MKPLAQQSTDVRAAICDRFLMAFSLIAVPALLASLYRISTIGWQPVMGMHILLACLLWVITLYRKNLPYSVRAVFTLFMLVAIGLAGIWQFNLVAAGIAFMVVAPVLGTLFFGFRGGVVVFTAMILPAIGIGVLSVSEARVPPFELAIYVTSAPAWILAILTWIFTGASSVLAVGFYSRHYMAALASSRHEAAAREASEREYRSILDNMTDTFYRVDLEGRVLMVSPSAKNLFGYSPDEMVGMVIRDFCVDPAQGWELFKRLQDDGKNITDFQSEIRNRDGGVVWVSINARFWEDSDENVRGVEGVIRNITAHKLAEGALRQSQKMEALGQMTGGVAHDFNNILAAILGYADLAALQLDNNRDEKLKRYLGEITQSGERAKRLVAQMLAFCRAEKVVATRVKLSDVIERLLSMVKPMIPVTIDIQAIIEKGLPDVMAEENQLDQVLMNLLINGRDAVDGKGTLTIEAESEQKSGVCRSCHEMFEGEFVRISVMDSSGTLQPDMIDKVFDPFFTTKEVGKGTGMGLSMVHGIVHGWGGHIDVEVVPGVRTAFNIYLPADQAE